MAGGLPAASRKDAALAKRLLLPTATFGPGGLSTPFPIPPTAFVQARGETALRERVRTEIPDAPGVYGMLDRHGEWAYVGKSKRLKTRLLSYFRAKSRAQKERRILDRAVAIAWEPQPNELAALVRELELIQRWRPFLNVQGQPGSRRHAFLCLTGSAVPKLRVERTPAANTKAWFGPLRAGYTAREAARRLNDWFGLADCPALALPTKPVCLRHDLGQCLGPCFAACTRRGYAAKLRAAKAFLDGADDAPLREIEAKIAAHSARLEFEIAGQWAPIRDALRWTLESLGRLRVAKGEYSFVYPLKGEGPSRVWYLIHGGLVVGCLPEPRTAAAGRAAAAQLTATFAGPPPETEKGGVLAFDLLLLVTAWFRKRPAALERTLSPAAALARCAPRPRRAAG
jgi:excinuclease ABC subunit C